MDLKLKDKVGIITGADMIFDECMVAYIFEKNSLLNY